MTDKNPQERFQRVLAIYANAKGFGYAVMEGVMDVQEKGQYTSAPIDNDELMRGVKWCIEKYNPDAIIMENMNDSIYRKVERTKKFAKRVRICAKKRGLGFSTYSRAMIRHVFERWKAYTKYEMALVICDNIPAFENFMYEKPAYPQREQHMVGVFDAVTLGVTHFFLTLEKEMRSNTDN